MKNPENMKQKKERLRSRRFLKAIIPFIVVSLPIRLFAQKDNICITTSEILRPFKTYEVVVDFGVSRDTIVVSALMTDVNCLSYTIVDDTLYLVYEISGQLTFPGNSKVILSTYTLHSPKIEQTNEIALYHPQDLGSAKNYLVLREGYISITLESGSSINIELISQDLIELKKSIIRALRQ
jgi:hypothetical protein